MSPPPPPKDPKRPIPRALTAQAGRNRDERETLAPPASVANQIAMTPRRNAIPSPQDLQKVDWEEDQRTPIGSTPLEAVDWRTQQMRTELRRDLDVMQDRMFRMAEAVSETSVSSATGLGDVTGKIGELAGKVEACMTAVELLTDKVLPILTVQATTVMQTNNITNLSNVKVAEASKLDVIESRKWWRSTFAQAIASGGVIAIIIQVLLRKC